MIDRQFSVGRGESGSAMLINYGESPSSGPPIVLLHGLTWRWQVFMPLLPALTHRWHVFALDFRGHGKSSHFPGCYRGEDYGSDTIAFLRERVKEPAVLFGHSLGGMVAMYVAAVEPRLVRGLVLGDNTISMRSLEESHYPALFRSVLRLIEEHPTIEQLAKCLAEVRVQLPGQDFSTPLSLVGGNDDAFFLFWARSLLQMDPGAIRMSLDGSAAANWRGAELLRHVQCPTLLLQANPAMGGLMSENDAQAACATLPACARVMLTQVGHQLYMQEVAPVQRALLNFLGSLE